MKKEKALELLYKFPQLTNELEDKMKRQLRTFILYDHKDNFRCTNCGKSLKMEQFGHKQTVACPECGKEATLIDCTNRYKGEAIESEKNVMVIMSSPGDENLYIRCFTLRMFFKHGSIIPIITLLEPQRYAFTPNGAARYGRDMKYNVRVFTDANGINHSCWTQYLSDEWVVRTKVTSPIFPNKAGYIALNKEAVRNTCCRYSGLDIVKFDYTVGPINYLLFWQKHKGVERLVKCGLQYIVNDCLSYPGYYPSKNAILSIQWNETEPHKMLGISRPAFAAIRNGRIRLDDYRTILRVFPDETLENQIVYNHIMRNQYGTLESVCKTAKSSCKEMMKYLKKQDVTIDIYSDYLRMSKEQRADMHDRAVLFPKNLMAAHDRRVSAREAIKRELREKQLKKRETQFHRNYKWRKVLEFTEDDYLIRQPLSLAEIVAEGAALSHCVSGYAERHADGKLSIMFLRKKTEPDKPYYTIEVSNNYKLVQCRGYKNNNVYSGGEVKPVEIEQLEKHYQQYLNTVKAKMDKQQKRKARKTA